jgi:arylsulfatase A-like enzyme
MASRPNILFLMTDHTNAQATAPGSACQTPHLDALAAEGVRFARGTTTNAICSPARASLMTATYPSTHGVWDCTHTQRSRWVDADPTLLHWSQRLAEAGYRTGYFGKWHVEQSRDLARFGWEEYDLSCSSLRLPAIPDTEVRIPTPGYRDHLLAAVGRDDEPDPPRHPAFEQGIDFLRRHACGEAPFCCFVSTSEPHDAYVPPRRFFERYVLDAVPLSPTLHDDLAGKPEVLRRMQAVWSSLTEDDWRRVSAAYRAVVSFLDHEVGRILDVLRETGAWDDTIIVFTSDHGDMLGGHGLATKGVGTSYEEVYNIPFILRVPGGASGEDTSTLTGLIDVGPTLLDLCGLAPLPAAQGRSLRPVLEGTADPADWQDAYAEFYGQRFVYTQRVVWHGTWKFVFSPGGIDELYDLASDPYETQNLAADPAHRARLEDMLRRMWRRMADIGDESLLNTHYATLRTASLGPLSVTEP